MIAAFGPLAEVYARGLADFDAIVAEPDTIVPALREALARREHGERFYAMVLLDHPGPTLTRRNAAGVLAEFSDYDMQAIALDQLANGLASTPDGKMIREYWTIEEKTAGLIGDFYALADAMLVRSYTEFARLAALSSRFVRPVERVLVEPQLPAVERVLPQRPGVLIWAPRRPALEITLHLVGLREFIGDLTCVTAGGRLPDAVDTAFLGPGDPGLAAVLARAACIVCVEPDDPGDAVAFARRGFGVVAPLTAGAHEFAGAVVPWSGTVSGLAACVSVGLGRPASFEASGTPAPRSPRPAPAPLPASQLPLVSIVCPTYNRPHDLRALLACIAAQTYPHIEVVVVNDAGSPVGDVVADFPFARLIDNPVNLGSSAAMEIGLAATHGGLVNLIADDDLFYPDHVERTVYAMLRSGGAIVHGAGLWRFVERQPDGSWKTLGVNIDFNATTTPSLALTGVPIMYQQILQRREAFAEVGWFRDDIASRDQELLLRMAQRFTFVYVDHVTCEVRDHSGGIGRNADLSAERQRMYQELHPRPERPLIEQARQRIVDGERNPTWGGRRNLGEGP